MKIAKCDHEALFCSLTGIGKSEHLPFPHGLIVAREVGREGLHERFTQ
jgi:hypothetical protein